jgi:hypothetical protein
MEPVFQALVHVASYAIDANNTEKPEILPENTLIDRSLVSEAQTHRSIFHLYRGVGIGFGIIGGGLLGGAAALGGIFAGGLAFGLSTGGVGFAVIGAVFLLMALIEFVRSRKAENRENNIPREASVSSNWGSETSSTRQGSISSYLRSDSFNVPN